MFLKGEKCITTTWSRVKDYLGGRICIMKKLEDMAFLTPVLVLLNLFATVILSGDLVAKVVENLFQKVIEKVDVVILTDIFAYALYFIGLLIIIALLNKAFDVKQQNETVLSHEKCWKIFIIVLTLGVLIFKVLIIWGMSEGIECDKIFFTILQILTIFIITHCICEKNLNELNSFKSLFFIDKNRAGIVYNGLWSINIVFLLFTLAVFVIFRLGVDGVIGVKDLIDFIKQTVLN